MKLWPFLRQGERGLRPGSLTFSWIDKSRMFIKIYPLYQSTNKPQELLSPRAPQNLVRKALLEIITLPIGIIKSNNKTLVVVGRAVVWNYNFLNFFDTTHRKRLDLFEFCFWKNKAITYFNLWSSNFFFEIATVVFEKIKFG